MKKLVSLLLVVTMALGCILGVVACGNGQSTEIIGGEQYSDTYSIDETEASESRKKPIVTLIQNSKRYTVEVENGEYLFDVELENGLYANAFSVNPSGNPLYDSAVLEDMTLYVVSTTRNVTGKTYSCAINNGYDTSNPSDDGNRRLANGWSLGEVVLKTEKQDSETTYDVSYKLTQDTHNLPHGTADVNNSIPLHTVWLNNNVYSGTIKDTSIKGQVGYGAFYVEVVYKNGSKETFDGINFLSATGKFQEEVLCFFREKESNPLKRMEIVVCYQLAFNNTLSHSLGCVWCADYRAEYKIDF